MTTKPEGKPFDAPFEVGDQVKIIAEWSDEKGQVRRLGERAPNLPDGYWLLEDGGLFPESNLEHYPFVVPPYLWEQP